MTLYQLFTKNPSEEIMEKILECFDISSLDDTIIFTRKDLLEKNTLNKIVQIRNEIEVYYLPCKAKKYLYDLNEKKLITILRQFVRIFGYFIFSKEKYIQGEKFITYQIMPLNKKNFLKLKKKDENYIVSFD